MASMDEAVLKRVLPHSMEAEQSVIGSMIMDREAIVIASELIHGEDFYNKSYGVLFDSMVELNDQGQPVDLVTLQNRLKEARCEKGLSQSQLAELVGVSRNTISSIETGQFNPTAKLALILCIALDRKFEDLFYF